MTIHKKDGRKTRQNDRGIAQVLCFARVIFLTTKQNTKSLDKKKGDGVIWEGGGEGGGVSDAMNAASDKKKGDGDIWVPQW
jgi:hypothetical protein